MLCFMSPSYAKGGRYEIFSLSPLAKLYPPPSKPWRRTCQGETVKVKFVYNRLTGENGGWPNQISHHLQKSMAAHVSFSNSNHYQVARLCSG